MTGWIKFNRSIIESEIWCSPFAIRLYLLLSSRAVQKEYVMVNEVKVKRGQYLRSYSLLAEDLMYVENGNMRIPSKTTIKKNVDRLVKYAYITIEETFYGTLFTLLEQEQDVFLRPENGCTAGGQHETNKSPARVQQEECKKGREEKEEERGGERIELPSEQDNQSKVDMITNQFLKLRNAGLYISPKEQCAIERICEMKMDGEMLMSWMERIDSDYRKRNEGETIRSFTYYEKALLQRIRKARSSSVTESSSARRIKETDNILAMLEQWKREGEERLANESERIRPVFNPA
jgi:hypothetical protein